MVPSGALFGRDVGPGPWSETGMERPAAAGLRIRPPIPAEDLVAVIDDTALATGEHDQVKPVVVVVDGTPDDQLASFALSAPEREVRFLVGEHDDATLLAAVCPAHLADHRTVESLLVHVIAGAIGVSPGAAPALASGGREHFVTSPDGSSPDRFDLSDTDQVRPAESGTTFGDSAFDSRRERVERGAVSAGDGLDVTDVLAAGWAAALHGWADLDTLVFTVPVDLRTRADRGSWGPLTADAIVVSRLDEADTLHSFASRLAKSRELAQDRPVVMFDQSPDAGARVESRTDGSSILTDYRLIMRHPLDVPGAVAEHGYDIERVPAVDGSGGADVALCAEDTPGGDVELTWLWRRSTDGAAAIATAQRFLQGFLRRWNEEPFAQVSSIPLVTPDEAATLLAAASGEVRSIDSRSAPQVIFESGADKGASTAIKTSTGSVTYDQLATTVERARRQFARDDWQPGGRVAVWMDRGADLVSVVLAVWAEGGVYLPIDTVTPVARVANLIASVRPAVLVTDQPVDPAVALAADAAGTRIVSSTAAGAPDGSVAARPFTPVAPRTGVYVMFTSGSTGTPKAVEVNLAGFNNHLEEKARLLGLSSADVMAQMAPTGFDIHVWQIAAPLVLGATVRIYSAEEVREPELLSRLMRRDGITVVNPVPSHLERWCHLAEASGTPEVFSVPTVRSVVVTGEAFPMALADRLATIFPNATLLNGYGQSECSHDVSHHVVDGQGRSGLVPIGRVVANTRLYLLDQWQRLRPPGLAGELAVAGVAVGNGYLGPDPRPSFRTDPFRGGPMYLTGDVCDNEGGCFFYRGRRDTQVKVGGRRIELGEIENACLRVPGVRLAATCVVGRTGGSALVAFVEADDQVGSDEIQSSLREHLPLALIPSVVHLVDRITLSRNGKVDRKALQLAADQLFAPREESVPSNDVVTHLWRRHVAAEVMDESDNFFKVGGDSLRAMELVAELNEQGYSLTVRDIYEHPTLRDLRALLYAPDAHPSPTPCSDRHLDQER
jgi:amino acid adenylation domain-containing protein